MFAEDSNPYLLKSWAAADTVLSIVSSSFPHSTQIVSDFTPIFLLRPLKIPLTLRNIGRFRLSRYLNESLLRIYGGDDLFGFDLRPGELWFSIQVMHGIPLVF